MQANGAATTGPMDTQHVVHAHRASPFGRFFTGVLAFSLGVFICGACGSYTPTDPSLNAAVDLPPGESISNLFGSYGAATADVLTQTFGWAAWLSGFALMAGGLRRTFGIGPRRPSRWLWATAALVFTCVCLAAWPIPKTWTLATGLGGVAGERLLHMFSMPFAALGMPSPVTLAAGFSGIASILFAAMAMGLGAQDGVALVHTIKQTAKGAGHVGAEAGAAVASGARDVVGLRERANAFFEGMRSRQPNQQQALPEPANEAVPVADAENNFMSRLEANEAKSTQPPVPVAPSAPTPAVAEPKKRSLFGGGKQETPQVEQAPAPVPATIATNSGPSVASNVRNAALPPMELLNAPPQRSNDINEAHLLEMADRLQVVLNDFGVKGRIVEVRPGPVVTLFELEPAPGTKSSRVIALAEDIARSMSATAARVAVVPGRNAIGIELPNDSRETVYLRDLLASNDFRKSRGALPLALGETIGGEPTIADLAKMPHLLIAGTTGSGKSVGINAMILSLLYKLTPEQCRFIMIDPKMLELSIYEGIPHLLSPVVIDPQKAVAALKWVVREMESRYEVMAKMGVRNISGFNTKAEEARRTGEVYTRPVQTGYEESTGEPIWENEVIDMRPMPHIVVVIDEMADLMIVAGKEIEALVQRLAQMARAAGIHLITATQRPSVDVITGTIKANFPTRISYMVTTKIDSRTILGEQGAEQLLGMGDLLFQASGGKLQRVHGPFVSDAEVEGIVNYLKEQGEPDYVEGITDEPEEDVSVADAAFGTSSGDPEEDLFREAVAIVRRDKRASTSYVQRRLKIGYNRAASLIERMEQEGIVSAANHAGKREILRPDDDEAA